MQKSELVTLKDSLWLKRQKIAGRCLASILKAAEQKIISAQPALSLCELESLTYQHCKAYGASPTFLGYKGFPSACCISVNKQLVHGIVSNYVLQPGDVVSIDVGVTYEGAIADAARTWIYGEPKDIRHKFLIEAGLKALKSAKLMVKIGNRIGAIGNSISKIATDSGFGVITEYGGHGLDYNTPHTSPFIENKSKADVGIRMVNGLTIAIEPMFVIGNTKTKIDSDGWTVLTDDIGCHFEDTVTLFNNEMHDITEMI